MKKIPKSISKIIDEFINGANKILRDRIKRIVLYGSYARRRL